MSQRTELVAMAAAGGVSIAELARRFDVSRKTIYKWLARHASDGQAGLQDRSRRPRRSPNRTPVAIEQKVLALREAHPAWGGRKLHHRLHHMNEPAPAASTITRILHDHARIQPSLDHPRPWQRFERAAPNELWQMDFKGPVALLHGGVSHPLTLVDDHSRYALSLKACANQKLVTVRAQLTHLFERYGLPQAILSDNGSPWRSPGYGLTALEIWLMRLDIRMLHGRPYHPQTQGKDERFHRTISVEVLQGRSFADEKSLQAAFDPWREIYNHQRPHESLGNQPPASRYRPSARSLPRQLPAIEYDACDQVRRVDKSGQLRFEGRKLRAGKALAGESVALRPTQTSGLWRVCYGRFCIGQVDLQVVGRDEFAHVLGAASGRCAPSASPHHVHEV